MHKNHQSIGCRRISFVTSQTSSETPNLFLFHVPTVISGQNSITKNRRRDHFKKFYYEKSNLNGECIFIIKHGGVPKRE